MSHFCIMIGAANGGDARSGLGLVAAAAAALLVGCASDADVYGYPVYPHPENPLPRSAIAKLYGPVITIDGVDVSAGAGAFDVMPGCHRIESSFASNAPIGRRNGSGYWRTRFILGMKAGYTYRLRYGLTAPVLAEEDAPSGQPVQVMNPARWRMQPDGTCADALALGSP